MRHWFTKAAVLLIAALPAGAHHSDSALDMNATHTFEGVVTEYTMRNPHAYFTVDVTDESGRTLEWEVQMASALTIGRRGWTRTTLAYGDRVAVTVRPARDGRPYGLLVSVERDGRPVVPGSAPAPVSRGPSTTTTIEGVWIVDRASLGPDYPGGLDQLMSRELTLTAAGRVANAEYSQNDPDNPELACMTKPTPGGIVYTDLYPMQIEFLDDDRIMIRSQYFDQERTVYMDGREHLPASESSHEGHSIGRWEGDVLVVDTTNFADNRSPYQNGIPSGPRKHVVERYRLLGDGNRMRAEFTLEDPDYIVGTMSHTRDMVYSPQLDMTPFDCDLEATRRYLPR